MRHVGLLRPDLAATPQAYIGDSYRIAVKVSLQPELPVSQIYHCGVQERC